MAFLKKIFMLLQALRWQRSRRYELLVFDDYSDKLLDQILGLPRDRIGLNTRNQRFWINHHILYFLGCNLLRHRPRLAYYLAVLQTFRPKAVITYNPLDRHLDQIIAHFKGPRYLSVSNGPMIVGYAQNITNRLFDCFYATNSFQLELLKKNGSQFTQAMVTGPFLNSYFMAKDDLAQEQVYDLCLISQFEGEFDDADYCHGFNQTVQSPAILLGQYLKKHPQLKVAVAMRSNQQRGIEEEFFRRHLGPSAELFTNYGGDLFASYRLLLKSKIVLGAYSTLCLEALDLGKKTILINCINPTFFTVVGDWKYTLTENSSQRLGELIEQLQSLSPEDYQRYLQSTDKWKINCPGQLAFQTIQRDLAKFLAAP